MTRRERDAQLIREVFADLEPAALTEGQFCRAADAARKTEKGREVEQAQTDAMSQEELDAAIIEDYSGLDAARLSPEQRQRILDASMEEYVASITVPEPEWDEARDWIIEARSDDRLKSIANLQASGCGQLIDLPDGRRISTTNLHSNLKCCGRDDRHAREWVEDVNTIRRMLEGAGR